MRRFKGETVCKVWAGLLDSLSHLMYMDRIAWEWLRTCILVLRIVSQ